MYSTPKLWLLFASGPVLFFLSFAALSGIFSIAGTPAAQIPEKVATFVPHCLMVVLGCVGLLMLTMKAEVLHAWKLPAVSAFAGDLLIGAVSGGLLAVLYFKWLGPAMEGLQRTFGDYVPPGSILPTLSGNMAVFFIANVILAPLVEETLYRGIALPALGNTLGPVVAIVISCMAFGLLHWAGGFWYMLLTGVIAGGAFAALYYLRGGLLAPFAAHFVLNLIEFAHAALSRGDS